MCAKKSDSDNDNASSSSRSSKGRGGKKTTGQSKPRTAKKDSSDDVTDAVSDGNQPLYLCPECDYSSPSAQSVRMHGLRKHRKPSPPPASEPNDDFEVNEIDELKARKTRLGLEREVARLEDDLRKSQGNDPGMERRLRGLEDTLRRRDEEVAIQRVERRFSQELHAMRDEIRRLRNDGHTRPPIQTGDSSRQFQDLMQTIHTLRGEIQVEKQNTLLGEVASLREQVQGGQNRRPELYEVEAGQQSKFMDTSSEVIKSLVQEVGHLRKDMARTREEIRREIMPMAKTLGEKMLGQKLRESASQEEYQPEERELTPEQLERLDKRLSKVHGEDYKEKMAEEELEETAAEELESMRTEFLEETTEEEIEKEIDEDDELEIEAT